jgi:hypothetical protein
MVVNNININNYNIGGDPYYQTLKAENEVKFPHINGPSAMLTIPATNTLNPVMNQSISKQSKVITNN